MRVLDLKNPASHSGAPYSTRPPVATATDSTVMLLWRSSTCTILSQNVEHPPCDLPDVSGFQYMREGKVGAEKIVYRDIQDISTLESLKGCWRWITYPSGEMRLAASWPPELGQDTTSLGELCPMSPASPTASSPSPSQIITPID
ncbi:hypothetical protein BGW80DRAFT_1462796 [Lactifluus volemus]|nr:hypothetical protein BGW80DRAFT_1462796 [Lactifluus volemus]